MIIAVVSDTHGSSESLKKAVAAVPAADAWVHLGDFAADAAFLMAAQAAPVFEVCGNCDCLYGYGSRAAAERVLEFEGVRILAVHGHTLGVDAGLQRLEYRAQELGCHVALYGHTHASLISPCGPLLLVNPGSPSRPRNQRKPSIALLDVANGDYSAKIALV